VGANDDMDDATPENLILLEGLAHKMMESKAAALDEVLGWFA
jgi:hypothetical protein